MKYAHKFPFIVLCSLFLSGICFSASAQDLVGTWQGRIFLRGDLLRVVFHFKKDSMNQMAGTFESPDQRAKKFNLDDVKVSGDSLSLEVPDIDAEYNAVYNKDSAFYFGIFNQHGFKMKLKLMKGEGDDFLYKRPQKPSKPYPYKEEEVTVENKKAGLTLAGTFIRPFADGKYPVVVMITGSGPEDRDETVFGHKPFLIIADYLVRRGIAVLRCDDRGTAKSTGEFDNATIEDFVSDANAQIDYLKTRNDIDLQRIGLIGHSEGGVIAPLVASRRNDVSYLVLLAGVAVKMFDNLILQDSLIGVSEGMSEKHLNQAAVVNRGVFKIVETAKDSASAADGIDSTLRAMNMGDREIEKNIRTLLSPWMQSYVHYDPKVALEKLHCRVLAINGDKDIQVPAAVNIAAFEKAMNNSKNLKTVILPGLNHLFQHCNTCTIHEYSQIEETFDPVALNTIGEWMTENVLKK